VLLLQGGGAFGAYQVGVDEAMNEAGIARRGHRHLDWRHHASLIAGIGPLKAQEMPL
jgi:hypothetical protein